MTKTPQTPTESPATAAPQSPPVDMTQILLATRGNPEIIKRLTDHLKNNYQIQIAVMQQAIAAADYGGLATAAHRFKGAVANFGARKAVELALQLELAGEQQHLEDPAALLAGLEREMQRVMACLDSFDKIEA